ncbi:MAG: hypothetical protein ACE5OP_04775 [Candidatus Glassbacteria bacterium]
MRSQDRLRSFMSVSAALMLAAATVQPGLAEMVSMAVHLDTEVSGGNFSIEEVATFLEKEGIDGAIFTDRDNAQITYGLYPLRRVIKKTMSFPSIESYGPKRYLEDIHRASGEHPGLILIAGAEAVPFYYWEGNYLTGDLKLMNWQEHMLVIGMENTQHFMCLPSIHRGFGGEGTFRVYSLILPAGLVVAGVYLIRKRIESSFRFDRLTYTTVRRWPRIPGALLLGLAILTLIEASPFDRREIDQYHGSQGAAPYQKLINYANSIGALTFWAHPEAGAKGSFEGIAYETYPYHSHLLESAGYDGFAIFWSGDKEIGSPGGIWDQVLRQYAKGEREKPVWAIGELDWDGVGGADMLSETLTLCFPAERSVEAVLAAMRSGRMVAVRNGVGTRLNSIEFHVSSGGLESLYIGDEIAVTDPPTITFSIDCVGEDDLLSEIQLIRNGKVIADSALPSDGKWSYQDLEMPAPDEIWYYRIMVGKGFPVLATNPIFVRGALTQVEGHVTAKMGETG